MVVDALVAVALSTAMCNGVSSAYWWYGTANREMTPPSDVMNSETRSGPSDEPCGTPVLKNTLTLNFFVLPLQKLLEQAKKNVAKKVAPFQKVIEGYGYQ